MTTMKNHTINFPIFFRMCSLLLTLYVGVGNYTVFAGNGNNYASGSTMFANCVFIEGDQLQDDLERIKAMKLSYITAQVGLTAEEAQQFWPVYDQYYDEMRKARKEVDNDPNIAESDKKIAKEEKRLTIKRKYNAKFKSIIGEDKVAKLYKAEEEFMQLLRESSGR